jgi:hypothetical protein
MQILDTFETYIGKYIIYLYKINYLVKFCGE